MYQFYDFVCVIQSVRAVTIVEMPVHMRQSLKMVRTKHRLCVRNLDAINLLIMKSKNLHNRCVRASIAICFCNSYISSPEVIYPFRSLYIIPFPVPKMYSHFNIQVFQFHPRMNSCRIFFFLVFHKELERLYNSNGISTLHVEPMKTKLCISTTWKVGLFC